MVKYLIEETVHTLKQFIGGSSNVAKPRKVKNKPELVEKARRLGGQMTETLERDR